MKLFEIAPSVATQIDTPDADIRTIYVWHKDSSNNICYLVLHRVVVNENDELNLDRLNSAEQGYDAIRAILDGTFEFVPTAKPIVYSKLLIQAPELSETDYFNPIFLGFFDGSLLGQGEKSAHSLFGFSFDRDIRINSNSNLDIPCVMASNIYNDSFNTKQYPRNARGPIWRAFVGVPVSSDIDYANVFIATFRQYHSKAIYSPTIQGDVVYCTPDEFYSTHILSAFPTCTITCVKDDADYIISGKCTFNGQPLSGIDIYLSSTGGYLGKRRVTTNANGEYSIKFLPLGLDANDTVNVQCGFRLFTGIADVDVTVA